MRSYRASNRFPFAGLLLLLLFVGVGGALSGYGAALVARTFYLIPLSPLALAILVGALVALAVRLGKVRSPFIAFIGGILIGALAYGVYWYGEYQTFAQEVIGQYGGTTDGKEGGSGLGMADVDRLLQRETGQPGIVGFIMLSAEEGFTITRAPSSSSSGINLQGNVALGYWGIELLAIALIAAFTGANRANAPYCDRERRWLNPNDFALVGSVGSLQRRDFINALKAGDFRTASAMIDPSGNTGLLRVVISNCIESDGSYLLQVIEPRRNNQVTTVLRGYIGTRDSEVLTNRPQVAPEPSLRYSF